MMRSRASMRLVALILVGALGIGLIGTVAAPHAAATVSGTPAALPTWFVPYPRDIDIDPATGYFHVIDQVDGLVRVYDAANGLVRSYGFGILNSPIQIALTPNRVYVSSLVNRVEYFDRETGLHLGGWGSSGTGAGQFDDATGITVDNNEVYVSDLGNGRVQVFTLSGAWKRTIDGAGTAYPLVAPRGLRIHKGLLYVADEGPDQVVVFNPLSGAPTGAIIVGLGTDPHDIAITTADDLFVSTIADSRVKVFTVSGVFQTQFDTASAGYGLVVDPSGDSLWVAAINSDTVEPYTYLTCAGLTPTVVGTSYNDTFSTGSGNDVVALGPGADDVRLGAGNDIACGGAGEDTIRGEGGEDTLVGDLAADFLLGGAGGDLIYGGAGADEIRGGGGNDVIIGGDGPDTIRGQGGADTIVGEAGNDKIDGQGSGDVIDGGPGNDIINGQNGADIMAGGAGADTIKGQTGPDELHGDADDDQLFGGNGGDTLYGGPGFDKCSGNTGPDSAQAATCEQAPGIETLF